MNSFRPEPAASASTGSVRTDMQIGAFRGMTSTHPGKLQVDFINQVVDPIVVERVDYGDILD